MKEEKTEKQRLIAFMKCDEYPYLQCGEVECFIEYGNVKIKGIEKFTFNPFFIRLYEEGIELYKKLQELVLKRQKKLDNIVETFDNQLTNNDVYVYGEEFEYLKSKCHPIDAPTKNSIFIGDRD